MPNIIFEDMVKVMERGQVTIPVKLREIFNLQKGYRLWIRVDQNRNIVLEPIKNEKAEKLSEWLKNMAKKNDVFWSKTDEKNLARTRKKSLERIRSLQW